MEEPEDSFRHRRQRRGGRTRRDGSPGVGLDDDDVFAGDADPVDGRAGPARGSSFDDDDGASLRRRRRRQRLERTPTSLRKSVTEMADIGARASRIARRKTGKLWRDLVDSTFDEYDGEGYYGYNNNNAESGESDSTSPPRSRRPRKRRSGFNWPQEPSRPVENYDSRQRRRRRGRGSMDEKREVAVPDAESSSDGDYYSDAYDPGFERESLRRRKRQRRREAGRRERQGPRSNGSRNDDDTTPPTGSTTKDSFATTTTSTFAEDGGKLPIGQILATLDERNVVYPPTASRRELEDLMLDSLGNDDVVAVKKAKQDIEVIEVESISPEDWKRQQEEKLEQKRKEQEQQQEEMKQNRQQQQTTNRSDVGGGASDSRPGRPNGRTGTTSATGSGNFYRRSIHNTYRPSGFSSATARAYGAGHSARQRGRRTPRSAAGAASSSSSRSPPPPPPQSSNNRSASGSLGAEARGSPFRASAATRRNSGVEEDPVPGSETGRRIYSPYGRRNQQSRSATTTATSSRRNRNEGDVGDIEDDFDRLYDFVEDDLGRFGDFLAESVDSIFWGTVEDYEDTIDRPPSAPPPSVGNRERNSSSTTTTNNNNTASGTRKRRHWKDRAEERLDRVLGVHKVGGKTYDRWAEREAAEAEEFEENRAMGYDAVSYIKGRRKGRPRPGRRRRSPKGFWEGDGSVLSVLLGNGRGSNNNADDLLEALRSNSNGDNNTLTVLIRNVLAVTVRLVGSVCSWASVRDTVPRPLVLLGGLSAGFLSRPGNRLKNALLAVLSFRVLGEWLRGGVPSSGGGDDDDDDYDDFEDGIE